MLQVILFQAEAQRALQCLVDDARVVYRKVVQKNDFFLHKLAVLDEHTSLQGPKDVIVMPVKLSQCFGYIYCSCSGTT